MKPSSRLACALLTGALATSALVAPASAGPTVLRDDQLKDLAVTPVLGRGYSLATNTFQSICLTDFPKTKASYNFHYKFEQIESDGSRKSDTEVGGSAEYGGGGLGFKANVKVSGSTQVIDNKTYHNHYILVTTTVDSYYSSIDESKARISDAARELLTSNDVPGFFDACGMYYIRSIGRNAQFISVFNYKTESSERDVSFEAKLDAELKGWGQRAKVDVETKGSIAQEASSKYLTITSTALGLGKDEKASLIAYDLDTFRNAIKDAFISMQQEDTGMVTSIEVVPWVENADFQRVLKLQESKPGADGKTISPYAQKRILNQNGEFLAEVDRVTRAKLNVYYKAKQCRARIDLDFKVDGQFRPELANASVLNHRSGAKTPLATLDGVLAPDKIEQLFTEYRNFLYGTATAEDPGAVTCVRDLLDAGITTRSHREIESCNKVEQQFAVISAQLIDENCMPKLAP
ncbi:MAG TPA: hypothetical protein VL463_29090 [Kofleriaceae bacterium]|nr:hypothetical protein [Kofleriaceae bacterium]